MTGLSSIVRLGHNEVNDHTMGGRILVFEWPPMFFAALLFWIPSLMTGYLHIEVTT